MATASASRAARLLHKAGETVGLDAASQAERRLEAIVRECTALTAEEGRLRGRWPTHSRASEQERDELRRALADVRQKRAALQEEAATVRAQLREAGRADRRALADDERAARQAWETMGVDELRAAVAEGQEEIAGIVAAEQEALTAINVSPLFTGLRQDLEGQAKMTARLTELRVRRAAVNTRVEGIAQHLGERRREALAAVVADVGEQDDAGQLAVMAAQKAELNRRAAAVAAQQRQLDSQIAKLRDALSAGPRDLADAGAAVTELADLRRELDSNVQVRAALDSQGQELQAQLEAIADLEREAQRRRAQQEAAVLLRQLAPAVKTTVDLLGQLEALRGRHGGAAFVMVPYGLGAALRRLLASLTIH